jgi:hypothetical protein
MGGQTTTTQNTSQQSQTQPWAATQPQLLGLLGNLGNVDNGVTPQQSAAAGALTTAASGLPNFGPQLTGTANSLLGGGPNYGGIPRAPTAICRARSRPISIRRGSIP